MKLYRCTKVIRISRDDSEADQHFYYNVREIKGSIENYYEGAAEYLYNLMIKDGYINQLANSKGR